MASSPGYASSERSRPQTDQRATLALIFLPGLYLVLAASMVLVVFVGGAILYGFVKLAGLIHRIPVGIMLLVALGVLYGLWALFKGVLASVRRATFFAHGTLLNSRDAPALFDLLQGLCKRMGCDVPSSLVIELGPNFFVTEATVHTFSARLRGRSLCLSAPLLRLLTVDEVKAVIAHELAHFTGSDTAFSRRFYPVYRGTSAAIASLHALSQNDSDSAAWMSSSLLLPLWLLTAYLSAFARFERGIGRDRELRADWLGANQTSPQTMASALIKVHAFAPAWSQVQQAVIEATKEQKAYRNVSRMFVEWARNQAGELTTQTLAAARSQLTHPTDTHPPLQDRLRNLKAEAPASQSAAQAPSAAWLVPELDRIEEELSQRFAALVAQLLVVGRAN